MQVKKFPEGEWWRKDFWFLPNELRNVCESLEGEIRSFHGDFYFSSKEYADLERRFKDKTEYLTFAYSNYGGDILQRLVCDSLDRLHKKPEDKLTDDERAIVDGSAFVCAAYGGAEWAVWHPALVADLKVWNSELYSHGLDWLEVLIGGYWEDALTELEDRLRNEEVDRLEHDYPALKDINPDGWLYEWLMNHGAVHATMVDYSESSLMHDLGKYLIEHEDVIDISKGPQFRWLKEELDKASDEVKESDLEYDACHKALLKIGDAYIKAEEELGYAFARGETEEFNAENKNMGWMPWNK